MIFRRRPTRVQWVMIALMAIAFAALLLWVVPEVLGIASPEAEDTFSEWVWDLPLPAVVLIALLFGIAGVLFVWSAGHFIEGYRRRRGIEKKDRVKP